MKVIFLFFFLSFYFPSSVSAAVSITSSPNSVALEEEFTINFTGSELQGQTQYYAKARIGQAGSYNKGETKNNDDWFGDTSSFENFPVFIADSSGNIDGSLFARAKSTASLGENSIFVRLRKVGTTTNSDSGPAVINLTQAPTPIPTSVPPTNTPTPIPSPTPTKTSTPTKTPTPTPTIKPTATVKVAQTPTATSIPTIKTSFSPTPEPEIEDNAPTSILGEMVTASPSASPTIAETKEASFFDLPKLVMGAGVVFVAASGILAFRRFHEKDNFN